MRPNISVICPVRERVVLVDRMLQTFYKTVEQRHLTEIVFRADYDDVPMVNYLRCRCERFIVGPRLGGYATLSVMINEAARLSTAPYVIVINDDVEFLTYGWDRLLYEECEKYPDGVFDIGVDTVLNNENFVFPCQSRCQIEALGCFYDERLVYPDIWLRDVVAPFGRAIHLSTVTIRHNWAGMTDDQHRSLALVQNSNYPALYEQCVREARARIRPMLSNVGVSA